MFNTSAICRLLDSQKPVNGTKELIHQVFIADKNYIVRKPKEPYQTNELEWFISQSRNIEDLKSFAGFVPKIWEEISEKTGIVNSNYGWCCLSKENGSQFWNAMKHLELDRHSRRAIMIYNRPTMHTDWIANRGNYNLNWQYKTPDSYKGLRGDFMCCQNNHFLIRGNKLEMTVHMRSLDAVFGYNADYIWFNWIFNKALQYLKKTYPELERGDMVIYADSVHVYERHFEDLERAAMFDSEDDSLFAVAPNRKLNNPYLLDPENNAAVSETKSEEKITYGSDEFKSKDMVNHPNHYNSNSIEHWDYVLANGYGYLLGCASKYVFRNRFKGSKDQDLDKVVAYCEKYTESFDSNNTNTAVNSSLDMINDLTDITPEERSILVYINLLHHSYTKQQCEGIVDLIKKEINNAKHR